MGKCIESLRDALILPTLEASISHWQLEIEDTDSDKTAFPSNHWLYLISHIPLRLQKALRTFQLTMDVMVSPFTCQFASLDLDSIIIFSPTKEEHIKHVCILFLRLHGAGVTLNQKKWKFFPEKGDYLGHLTRPGRLELAPRTTDTIGDWNGITSFWFMQFILTHPSENCTNCPMQG